VETAVRIFSILEYIRVCLIPLRVSTAYFAALLPSLYMPYFPAKSALEVYSES
jgi:hypothetical protein